MSADEEITLTQEQKNFAKKISDETGVSKAEWMNTYVLDVTYDLYSGVYTKNLAKLAAVIIAAEGYLYTAQNICVKVINSEIGELAYECSGDQSET